RQLQLGLPVILTGSLEDLEEPLATQLIDALMEIHREVGRLFLKDGDVPHAWMYLRNADARAEVADALETAEPDEDNLDDWIAVAVREGVAPRRGFQVVLEQYGTCNAITMYDGESPNFTPDAKAEVAGLLIAQVHGELLSNLVSEIAREESESPKETTIKELLADREWLFDDDAYHIDTSHLSSVVRFSRFVTDPAALRAALDLTEYGRRLNSQFQYDQEEPFADYYVDHGRFLAAQLGESVEDHLKFFQEKTVSVDAEQVGCFTIEVYILLLARLERFQEAFEAHRDLISQTAYTSGFAPSLIELAQSAGAYADLQEVCRDRGNRLGFVAGLVEQMQSPT
ncbi:MAG: hypothetical protein N2C14_29690, partial [Planctomycetales bacterium]